MVPVEQLNNVNFLNVYYLASEIKHEMEMNPDPSKKATITDHIYQPTVNPVYGYPYFSQVRVRTFTYLNSIGAIVDFFHSESYHKIHFTPIPQDEFFAFCGKLARIYWERFPKPSEHETNAKSLSDEQASKLKLVLDTIAFKLKEYGDEDELDADSLLGPITIPYNHFSSSLEPFDINGLLYKLANDFHLIMTPKSDAKVVSFDFPMTSDRETFYKFKSAIDKRCSAIVAKEQTGSTVQFEEKIQKVEVINPHLNVKVQTNGITSKIGRFPEKLKAGTQWKNITIVFSDERDALIHIDKKSYPITPESIGLTKGRKLSLPTATWEFLETLARHSGEIAPGDPDVKLTFKKQKELLSKVLQTYFSKEEDPFFPYESSPEKRHRSYKARFGIFYKQKETKNPYSDLDAVMEEAMPQI